MLLPAPSSKGTLAPLSSYSKFSSEVDVSMTNAPIAAGVPAVEVIRRMVEEKVINRKEEILVISILCDPKFQQRERIMKALTDFEIGADPAFSVRRLKAIIYQNGSGERSMRKMPKNFVIEASEPAFGSSILSPRNTQQVAVSEENPIVFSYQSKMNDAVTLNASLSTPKKVAAENAIMLNRIGDFSTNTKRSNKSNQSKPVSIQTLVTLKTVAQVVGPAPVYSGPDTLSALNKIEMRLRAVLTKQVNAAAEVPIKFAVLIGSGSFNPLTRMHMRTFFLAKQHLESVCGVFVLGSLVSPAHSVTVRERYRNQPAEILPAPHRIAIAQLMVERSKWLSIDPWEITRRRAMDYLSLLQHATNILKTKFPALDVKIFYVCKATMITKISPQAMRAGDYGCVCVCRTPEAESLRNSLSKKWNGLLWVVEDSAILDASMDLVTSRKVRNLLKSGVAVEHLVGRRVQEYITSQKLTEKMMGLEDWEEVERRLPQIASRPTVVSKSSLWTRQDVDDISNPMTFSVH